jgi:hypothetical protein
MSRKKASDTDQLLIPFEEIIENLGVPANYDFGKLKKIFLPNNPLTDYPLFLPSKTKAVNNSRIRFRYLFENKKDAVAPKVDVNDLLYKSRDFTIKADMDYGLPDEFDGQVFDCLVMLISKEYVEKSKVFKGYRIDETHIMHELAGQNGYVIGGTLYNRIKYSLNRMFHTSYIINQESIDGKGVLNYIEILYRLIDGIYRKGMRYKDTDGIVKEFDHTVVLPHSAILNSIEEKKYFIISNEKRYALKRYMSKVIYDRLHLVVYAQIHAMAKDMFIAQKCNSYPFFVIGYKKFCEKIGIFPLVDKEMRPAIIKRQMDDYITELIEQDILLSFEVDKAKTLDKSFNLVFIFKWEFVDRVFEMANKSMDFKGISDISKEQIDAYFKKLETQIKSVPIKNKIKGKE